MYQKKIMFVFFNSLKPLQIEIIENEKIIDLLYGIILSAILPSFPISFQFLLSSVGLNCILCILSALLQNSI